MQIGRCYLSYSLREIWLLITTRRPPSFEILHVFNKIISSDNLHKQNGREDFVCITDLFHSTACHDIFCVAKGCQESLSLYIYIIYILSTRSIIAQNGYGDNDGFARAAERP